jgi:hypothetical protein
MGFVKQDRQSVLRGAFSRHIQDSAKKEVL